MSSVLGKRLLHIRMDVVETNILFAIRRKILDPKRVALAGLRSRSQTTGHASPRSPAEVADDDADDADVTLPNHRRLSGAWSMDGLSRPSRGGPCNDSVIYGQRNAADAQSVPLVLATPTCRGSRETAWRKLRAADLKTASLM